VSRKELVLKAHGGYRGPSTRRDRPQADDPDSLRVTLSVDDGGLRTK
jgi:hypothetical protein